LSIFTIVLARLSGQQDIIVGTPTAGRRHADLENIIGMFVNTLVMRNYPGGEKRFPAYLKEVKERTLQAFENQEYPFEDLVGRLSVKRDPRRNPIFDVMLNHLDTSTAGNPIPHRLNKTGIPYREKETTLPGPGPVSAIFDLTLSINSVDGELIFTFEYCVKLFKKETIERFTRYLKNTITGVSANPETQLKTIDILPGEEKKRMLIDFNRTTIDYPLDKTLHRLFEEQAAGGPPTISH
ncbi:MAG: hypothetical protein GY757_59390, partial [bacterium]|nr:hypothetical protein [bacterium]